MTTRQVVYKTVGLNAEQLKAVYDWSYKSFYSWQNITRPFSTQQPQQIVSILVYAGGWKKFEPLWNFMIQDKGIEQDAPTSLKHILSSNVVEKKKVMRHHPFQQLHNGPVLPRNLCLPYKKKILKHNCHEKRAYKNSGGYYRRDPIQSCFLARKDGIKRLSFMMPFC
jgi:hypothetical protein